MCLVVAPGQFCYSEPAFELWNHVVSKQAGSEADGVRYAIANCEFRIADFEGEIKKVLTHIAHPTSMNPYCF
jgi:hypothetical protein